MADALWRASRDAIQRDRFDDLIALWQRWLLQDMPERALLAQSLGLLLEDGIPMDRLFDRGIAVLAYEIGDAWNTGLIGVGDEHLVTHQIYDALHSIRLEAVRAGVPHPSNSAESLPRALVAASEGNEHAMGAFMTRLVLEAEGVPVTYLGANVPYDELAAQQLRTGASLVCVSFSIAQSVADVGRLLRALDRAQDPTRPYRLALGGGDVANMPIEQEVEGLSLATHRGAAPDSIRAFARLEEFVPWSRA